MPRYILEPVDLEHEDWQASTHKDRCRVTAPDKESARYFADAAFRIATQRSKLNASIPMSPWMNSERVAIQEEANGDGIDSIGFPPLVEIPNYIEAEKEIDDWPDVDARPDWDLGSFIWTNYPRSEYIEQAVLHLRTTGHEVDDEGFLTDGQSENVDSRHDGRARYDGAISYNGDSIIPTPNTLNAAPIGSSPTAGTAPTASEVRHEPEQKPAVWKESKWDEANWAEEESDQDEIGVAGDNKSEDGAEFTGSEDWNLGHGQEDLNEGTGHEDYMKQADTVTETSKQASGFSRGFSAGFGNSRNRSTLESPKVVVRYILSNPNEYRFLAQELERVLTDVSNGKYNTRMNEHPLWGTLDNTAELEKIFGELRDELREFNRLLREQQPSTQQLEKTTRNVQSKIIHGFATVANSPFGKTVQVGLGGFVVAYMYQFGLAMGVPPLESTTLAVVKQFLPSGD